MDAQAMEISDSKGDAAAWDGAEDGAKLSELMRLRVQDLDLKRNQVVVRCGKGGKDRVAPLSERLVADIEAHLVKVRALFEEDLHTCHAKAGHGGAQSAGQSVEDGSEGCLSSIARRATLEGMRPET